MLQANPGLTPPLIKAILQYSAQPLANASLVQQGAGQLNVDGALAMAKALRTDIWPLVESASLPTGSPLLAAGKVLPNPISTVNGTTFNWSRIVFAGGNHVLSGTALFTQHQGIWDPRLTWANGIVRGTWPQFWNGPGYPPRTYIKSVSVADYTGYAVVGAGVKVANGLVGSSSLAGRTGIFVPTATLTGWLVSGSGQTLLRPLTLSQGLVTSEGRHGYRHGRGHGCSQNPRQR